MKLIKKEIKPNGLPLKKGIKKTRKLRHGINSTPTSIKI